VRSRIVDTYNHVRHIPTERGALDEPRYVRWLSELRLKDHRSFAYLRQWRDEMPRTQSSADTDESQAAQAADRDLETQLRFEEALTEELAAPTPAEEILIEYYSLVSPFEVGEPLLGVIDRMPYWTDGLIAWRVFAEWGFVALHHLYIPLRDRYLPRQYITYEHSLQVPSALERVMEREWGRPLHEVFPDIPVRDS